MGIEATLSPAGFSRLAHVQSHLEGGFDLPRILRFIETRTGDPVACMGRLASHALAEAMAAWFVRRSLVELKQWLFVSARLRKEVDLAEPSTTGPLGQFQELLMVLVCDEPEIRRWASNFDGVYDLKRVEKITTADFIAYQAIVALRGDWKRLRARAEAALATPPKTDLRSYQADHRFHLALASGDVAAMESALSELTSEAVVRDRADVESGYTQDLIFAPAVILAKIAWIHGYPVRVHSPLVPAEWLPVQALVNYDLHYDFLRRIAA